MIFVETYLWSYLLVRLILIRASHASCRETCIFRPTRRGQKSKLQGTRIYSGALLVHSKSRDSGIRFYSPGIWSVARDIYTTCARAFTSRIVSPIGSHFSRAIDALRRISFLFFFLHDVTRVDNFHAGGEEGEAKEKKEKKEITARKSAVLLPTRIRVAQTHQITVPSDGRVPLTFRPRRLSSYWRLFFLFVPAARGGTLFLAPAFSRRFPRVYSTRRKSHLPTEGPTPEGLYNDTRVIDTFFTMRLGWLY